MTGPAYSGEIVLDPRMRALSIKQPYPHHIFYDGKPVENREWPTRYRGPVLIHAGKKDDEDRELIREKQMPLGGIVGIARLVDCVTEYESDWFFGPYGFVLTDAMPLPLVPCKGQLGFFRPDDEVLRTIAEHLNRLLPPHPSPESLGG